MITGKDFPVFDCDAHVVEPAAMWEHVPEADRDLVKSSYWSDEFMSPLGILNGRRMAYVTPGFRTAGAGGSIRGPGCPPEVQRVLHTRELTPDQWEYLDHKGVRDPEVRLADMDLMGIDQVLVVPTMANNYLYFIENAYAAAAVARAINDWMFEYCQFRPDRLFPCGILPVHNPMLAIQEAIRLAERGVKVVAVRPIDAQGLYPNQAAFELLWDTLEGLEMVVGMHTFPAGEMILASNPDGAQYSPGELLWLHGTTTGRHMVTSQVASFVYEAVTWLSYVTLSGFLDRHPRLRMTVFESNAAWLPMVLGRCDRIFDLYADLRPDGAGRRPSAAFREQCRISFESDESVVFALHDYFSDIAIWASDAYHHDAADAWEAIENMEKVGVPKDAQARMMGTNACELYGIEPQLFVTERKPFDAPDWFPSEAEVEEALVPERVLAENVPADSLAGLILQMLSGGAVLGTRRERH